MYDAVYDCITFVPSGRDSPAGRIQRTTNRTGLILRSTSRKEQKTRAAGNLGLPSVLAGKGVLAMISTGHNTERSTQVIILRGAHVQVRRKPKKTFANLSRRWSTYEKTVLLIAELWGANNITSFDRDHFTESKPL